MIKSTSNPKDFEIDTNDRGQVILRRIGRNGKSTPVVDTSTGELFVSQLEASEAYGVSSSHVHESVTNGRPICKNGAVLRYATSDEVLDWMTDPTRSKYTKTSKPALKPIDTAEAVEEVRGEIIDKVKLLREQFAYLKGQLADALSEVDRLTLENRRLQEQTAATAVEGFEFPGGPAVLRIGKDCVIMRPTKAELPAELVAVCKWRS